MKKNDALRKARAEIKDDSSVLKKNAVIKHYVEEKKNIEKAVKKRNPLIKEYLKIYTDQEKDANSYIGRMVKKVATVVKEQEILDRAIKLCKDENDKQELMREREQLNNRQELKDYENYLKGLKYITGISEEIEQEARDFFTEKLRAPITDESIFHEYRNAEEEPAKTEQEKVLKEYQKKVAEAKAYELYGKRAYHKDTIENQFLKDYPLAERKTVQYYTDRSTPSAMCVGMMLREGYKIEEILDPEMHQEKKREIGNKYREKREASQSVWHMEEMYENAEALIRAFKQYVKDHKDELKTERDMVLHSNRLGMIGGLCFDISQELHKFGSAIRQDVKTPEEVQNMIAEVEKYRCATELYNTKIMYQMDNLSAAHVQDSMNHVMYGEKFLEEIQKEDPDYDDVLMTADEQADIRHQLPYIPEMKEIFEDEDAKDENNMTREEAKAIASFYNGEYFKKNKISYHHARMPVTVTGTPEAGPGDLAATEKDQKINFLIVKDNRQLVSTNVPAKFQIFLKQMEKNEMRGKASGNSNEFNNMVRVFDAVLTSLNSKEKNNAEDMEKLNQLKETAAAYILAKRAQKGYESVNVKDQQVNDQMLGKAKGGESIFTSRGKERYDFALKIFDAASEMQKALAQAEQKKQMKAAVIEEMEMETF